MLSMVKRQAYLVLIHTSFTLCRHFIKDHFVAYEMRTIWYYRRVGDASSLCLIANETTIARIHEASNNLSQKFVSKHITVQQLSSSDYGYVARWQDKRIMLLRCRHLSELCRLRSNSRWTHSLHSSIAVGHQLARANTLAVRARCPPRRRHVILACNAKLSPWAKFSVWAPP